MLLDTDSAVARVLPLAGASTAGISIAFAPVYGRHLQSGDRQSSQENYATAGT